MSNKTKALILGSLVLTSYLFSYVSRGICSTLILMALGFGWFWLATLKDSESTDLPVNISGFEQNQIGNVMKDGTRVTVYDQDGRVICNFTTSPNSRVTHFTGNSVTIQDGRQVRMFDAQGRPGRSYNV